MEQTELVACPFCGNSAIVVEIGGGHFFKVKCRNIMECGAETEQFDEEDEAVAAWTRRTPLPDNEPLSLTELKQMNGIPVWAVSPFETIPTGWWLVHKCYDGTISFCGVDRALNEYELRRARSPILFYRQPPEPLEERNGKD